MILGEYKKQIMRRRTKRIFRHWKLKAGVFLIAAALATAGCISLVVAISDFFDGHTFIYKPVVQVQFNKPLSIIKRQQTVVQIINQLPEFDGAKTDIEKYICGKFGVYNCAIALAVFKSESGLREDAWHVNNNGSIDVGTAQINSINWKLAGCSLKEISDQYKNVDCAYKIWDRADGVEGNDQGNFTPWTVFTTGSFMSNVK